VIAQRDITHFPTGSNVATDAQHRVEICVRHLSTNSTVSLSRHANTTRTIGPSRGSPVSFFRRGGSRSRFIISRGALHAARETRRKAVLAGCRMRFGTVNGP